MQSRLADRAEKQFSENERKDGVHRDDHKGGDEGTNIFGKEHYVAGVAFGVHVFDHVARVFFRHEDGEENGKDQSQRGGADLLHQTESGGLLKRRGA